MSALDDLKKMLKQAQTGNFEVEPEIEEIQEEAIPELSPLEQLKDLLREAAPKYVPKEIIEESIKAEIETLSEKDIVQMTADLLGKSNKANNIPAAPQDIESQRWNDPLRNTDFVTQKQMNDHYNLFLQRIQQQMSTMGGSGEVKFRYLDDVNRATLTPNNDNHVLEYDAATKKVQFTEDIGPVKSIKLNTSGPSIEAIPGMLSWNAAEDCMDIVQNDGSVLQSGLETYIRIHNHTGQTLPNGAVVRFAGVTADALGVPTAELMDATTDPTFLIGVVTSDIPHETTGRATNFGNIRGVDTTGTSVGEVWAVGDILWIHPTIAGALTKIKPTAPDFVATVAAVMIVDATEGILLVRPTFAPKLNYGTFLNSGNHVASAPNTPTNIPIDTLIKTRGFTLTGGTNSRVTADVSGLYNFAVSYQMTSTNSSAKNIYFWLRRSGVDVPSTTRRQTITGNGVYATFACNWAVSLDASDYVQLMWATTDTTVILEAPPATTFAPASPSVLLSISEAAL